MSPKLLQKVVYSGANLTSFDKGSENLAEMLELEVNTKQVERVTERIGTERCAERDAEVARYLSLPLVERKGKPAEVTAPAVAVGMVDGGRLQIRQDDSGVSAEAGEDDPSLPPTPEHRGTHWREDKIGILMTMKSEEQTSDPCPEVPTAFVDPTRIVKLTRELKVKKSASVEESKQEAAGPTETPEVAEQVLCAEGERGEWQPPEMVTKQLTATRQPWDVFGPMVATMAWTLGFFLAMRKAFVGDGSDNNWTLWRKQFSSFVPILDIIHAISYVFAAAMAGRLSFKEGWDCYVRWITLVWQGQVEQVIAELAQRQAELGSPEPSDGDTHPRVIVSTALGYFQNHKDKMRYPEYRRLGLPITSSYVESAVKQFNYRVKGTEKFWTEKGAEALLQLRADYLCTNTPLTEFWQSRQNNATGQNSYSHVV